MRDTGGRYDVVGVDPRFVGRSTPLNCHWPTGSAFRGAGRDRAAFDRTTAFAEDLARRCRAYAGDLLPYATTRNTARDMDVVRAALGERRISYLGYSYGSYLGEVYATMFPERTGRVVLDGVIDPDRYGPRLLHGTEAANRHALGDWAAWAAARDATYGLGRTRGAVLAAVDQVRVAAGHTPLRLGGYRVDDRIVPVLVFNGLSQDNDAAYGDLARAVRDMRRAADGHPVTPSPWLADSLGFLLTGSDSSYGSAQTSILYGDRAAPRDPDVYWRDVQRSRAEDPLFAPVADDIGPCAFWDPPRERPTMIRDDLSALLVNATGDPRTTYRGARAGDAPPVALLPPGHPARRGPARRVRCLRQLLCRHHGRRLPRHRPPAGRRRHLRAAGAESVAGYVFSPRPLRPPTPTVVDPKDVNGSKDRVRGNTGGVRGSWVALLVAGGRRPTVRRGQGRRPGGAGDRGRGGTACRLAPGRWCLGGAGRHVRRQYQDATALAGAVSAASSARPAGP